MNTSATRNPRTMVIGAAVLCALGIVGITSAIILAATSTHTSAHAAPAQPAATVPVTPAQHSTPITPAAPVTPPPHSNPADVPSASVASLQRQLGQLNYYEGADNGIMNHQTVQAIDYLQREAGLPRTGSMNPATDTALIHELASGNSQMGGN
jgi:peptidoglycan hydrolase-like protein with peptidoglycan-binding domain